MDIFDLETKQEESRPEEELGRRLESLFGLRQRQRRKAYIILSFAIYAVYVSLFVALGIVLEKKGVKTGYLAGIGGGLAILVQAAINALANNVPSVKKLDKDIEAINRQLFPESFHGAAELSDAAKRAKKTGIIIGIFWLAAAFLAGIPICLAYGFSGVVFILAGLTAACYGFSIAITKSYKPGIKTVFLPGALLVLPMAAAHFFLQDPQNPGDIPFLAGMWVGIALFIASILILTHPQRKARIFLKLNQKNYWAVPSHIEGMFAEVYNRKGDRALISVYADSRHTVRVEKKTEDSFEPVGQERKFFLYISALYHAASELIRLSKADDGRPEDGFAHRYDSIKEVAQAISRFGFLEGKVEAAEGYETLTIAFHRCLTMKIEEGIVLINGAVFMLNWNVDMVTDLVSKLLNEEIILFEYKRKRIFFSRQALDFLLQKYRGKKCRVYSGINIYLEPEKNN